MRAAACPTYGPPEVVTVEEVPAPELDSGQVRVRVRAAAVNFPDVLLVADRYQVTVAHPVRAGSEFVGLVTEVADGVRGVAIGDRVAGTVMVGAFAEEVTVGASAVRVVPPGWRTGMPPPSGWRGGRRTTSSDRLAGSRRGDQLVVLGAGRRSRSGRGRSLGSHLGCLGDRSGLVHRQVGRRPGGGPRSISSSTPRSTCGQALREVLPGGADVVVDPVGGDLAEPALRSLHWGGRFVTVGYASG